MFGKIKIIAFFLALLLMAACANMVTPTGGPKDTTPPRVVEAFPVNHNTMFDGKKIELTFDEYVTLENASQNVLFSPPLTIKPDIKLNNKTVVIKFKEALMPNTTYTINFGNAVKDLHEGNIFKDYYYSFSTGAVLDTMFLEGKVINANDKKAAENMLVTLYEASKDSLFDLPTRQVPDFITKTEKDGSFKFHGLPDKDFLVFALEDMNANMFYDMPNEKVAFLDTLVHSQSKDLILYTFTEQDTTQMLLEKKLVDEGVLRFAFRKPADSVIFETPNVLMDSLQIAKVWSEAHDTLWWYFNQKQMDTLRICISYDTIIKDNSLINLKYKEQQIRGRKKIKRIGVSYNIKNGLLMPKEDLILKFTEPITEIRFHDTSSLQADTLVQYNGLVFEQTDAAGMAYRLVTTVKDSVNYTLKITDSVFYGQCGHTNEALTIKFKRAKDTDWGNIQLRVIPPENTSVIVQLLSSKDKVLDSQVIDTVQQISFSRLVPEKYKLRAIIDRDKNGKWSSGNYHQRFLPESIVEYKDILEVKAGWDIDLEAPWKLN